MFPEDKNDRGALAALTVALLSIILVVWLVQPETTSNFNPWHDTYAQIVSAVATITSTFISFLALMFLIGTWKEAKRGADAAWNATKHGETAAKAAIAAVEQAEKTNKIAETNAVADRRPWLSMQIDPVGGVKFDDNGSLSIEVRPIIQNHGRIPALQVNFAVRAIAFKNFDQVIEEYNQFCSNQKSDIEKTKEIFDQKKSSGSVVFPNQEWKPLKHGIAVSSTDIAKHQHDLFAQMRDLRA